MADVPASVLDRLHAGEDESVTLAEILSIDFATLMGTFAPALEARARRSFHVDGQRLGVLERMRLAAALLTEDQGTEWLERAGSHRSDTIRGWACYGLAAWPRLSLKARLAKFKPLADDRHSGVREWAWIALRPHVLEDLDTAITLLTPWTAHSSSNIRRFACEITRPRGVWCAHAQALKDDPAPGLPILEPLRDDPTKYVQDSVANWLNDASKSNPAWVKSLCVRWARQSPTKATLRICRRAQRSLSRG